MIESLNYPINSNLILRKKKSIKKELLSIQTLQRVEKKIAILGGSTTSELKNVLELFLLKNGVQPIFYESEYNKYYEDALFGNKELEEFNPDIIYIHTTNVNIVSFPQVSDDEKTVETLLQNELQKFRSIWEALTQYNCPIIQNNFDYTLNRTLGNLDGADFHGKTHFITKLNLEFAKKSTIIDNLYINDINYLSSFIGIQNWFDKKIWFTAKYAMSFDSIPYLAHNISKIINAILGKTKKCLVLDLDNTCWGGVIGDDGLNGIQIGTETALSEAYTAFQKYVKELKSRGIILAVCSKNDHENAKEGFSHPDSILKYDDFTSFKANWNTKDSNIVDIAHEINIGIDSLVFIDDNPVERDIVHSQVPQVSVPDVGNEVTAYNDHIDGNGYFEIISLSNDDLKRNKYYKENKKRENSQKTFTNYNDFLKSLEMKAEICEFKDIYLERITQLINKTNQFNLTTKRYTRAEIDQINENESYIKLYGKLTDKYGDNGLISIVLGELKEEQLHVDVWLMSCRVLKRDMEYAMLDELVNECRKKGVKEIIGYYCKTVKNNMVADLFPKLGFTLVNKNNDNTIWKLNIEKYNFKNNIIKIENE